MKTTNTTLLQAYIFFFSLFIAVIGILFVSLPLLLFRIFNLARMIHTSMIGYLDLDNFIFLMNSCMIHMGVGNRFGTPTHIGLFSIDGTLKKGDFFTTCSAYIPLTICHSLSST
jgi:hypothetical protein